jgi:hypothetical protein
MFQILPRHVSVSGRHLQGVVGALATQAMSVLWAYTDNDPSSVANCCGMYHSMTTGHTGKF